MPIHHSNANVVSTCNLRLEALKKHVQAKTTMKAGGKQTKLADLVAIYQAAIDTRNALVPQRAAYDKALAARDSAESARQATDKQLKAWVINEFGADSPEAKEFGFSPRKTSARTAATVFKATEQGKATRQARGTRGKRQKEKVKGATIVVSAAPAEPATLAPAASPAAVAPAATNGTPASVPSSNGAAASH